MTELTIDFWLNIYSINTKQKEMLSLLEKNRVELLVEYP